MAISAPIVAVALTLALQAVGCDRPKDDKTTNKPGSSTTVTPQSDDELNATLAKIDDVEITVREFQDRINRQSPYIRARYTSLEQKKEFLDSLVRFEVLAKEAHARGFDKDPEVVRTMKQVMIQKLMKDEFETKLTPESISEDEMKKFYDEHKSDYHKPEEVRVSAIILKTKKRADEVGKLASGPQGKTNKAFRDLVTKYSTDEKTKVRGGDLRYFSPEAKEIPKPVLDAAFALSKTGDTAGPIDAGDGRFFVIKQTGKRKAVSKSFEQVKRQIQNRLYREKRTQSQKDFIAALRKKANIQIDEVNLSKVRIDSSSAGGDGHGHGQPGLPGKRPGQPGHGQPSGSAPGGAGEKPPAKSAH